MFCLFALYESIIVFYIKKFLLPSTAGKFPEIPRITVNRWNNCHRRKLCALYSHVHVHAKLYGMRYECI